MGLFGIFGVIMNVLKQFLDFIFGADDLAREIVEEEESPVLKDLSESAEVMSFKFLKKER